MEPQDLGSSNATSAPTAEQAWSDYIAPFAAAIGVTKTEVTERLKALVGDPGFEAIDALKNEEYTPFTDILTLLSSVPSARLRKAVAENLRIKQNSAPAGSLAPMNNLSLDASLGILPSVPDDASLLAQLKANASLKVSQATVILAVRAALAERCGYFQIPVLLIDRMEQYAESLDETVGEDFYKLRKLISQRNYAEIYEGMPGIDGNFVSQKRRDAFLKRLDTLLLPAPIIPFANILTNRILEIHRGRGRHGSYGMGIGLTQGDVEQFGAQALYAGDLLKPTILRDIRLRMRKYCSPKPGSVGRKCTLVCFAPMERVMAQDRFLPRQTHLRSRRATTLRTYGKATFGPDGLIP